MLVRLRLALVVTGALFLTSCDDERFGEDAISFVENDAYILSKQLVTNDLALRWPNAFKVELVNIAAELDGISTEMPNFVAINTSLEQDDADVAVVKSLIFYDATLTHVRTVRDKLENLSSGVTALTDICDNRQAFDKLGIARMAQISLLGSIKIPQPEFKIYLSFGGSTDSDEDKNQKGGRSDPDFFTSLFSSVMSVINQKEFDAQMALFDRARAEYSSNVVQPPEVYEISKDACRTAFSAVQSNFSEARQVISEYQALAIKIEAGLHLMQENAYARMSPTQLKTAVENSGALALFETWRRQFYQGRIARDLGIAISELNTLSAAVSEQKNCVATLATVERFRDTRKTLLAEMDVVLSELRDTEVGERIADRRQSIVSGDAAIDEKNRILLQTRCR